MTYCAEKEFNNNDYNINENLYNKSELFNLCKAKGLAKKGCFITNIHFNDDESMHYWNGEFYYEDGAVITFEYLSAQDIFVGNVWRIKYTPEEVDKEILDKMHKDMKGYMLSASNKYNTYEEAIKKEE